MRNQIRIQQLKLMRIHADPDTDPKPWSTRYVLVLFSVSDPHHFNAEPDQDPAFHFNMNPIQLFISMGTRILILIKMMRTSKH
jgi:hypothetical protein